MSRRRLVDGHLQPQAFHNHAAACHCSHRLSMQATKQTMEGAVAKIDDACTTLTAKFLHHEGLKHEDLAQLKLTVKGAVDTVNRFLAVLVDW